MKKEKSCGTIIINDNKVLLIKQNQGFYGFPKGHMENEETEVDTAIRETKEETNMDVIIDENHRYEISYMINDNTKKDVVFFLAKSKNPNDVVSQDSEVEKSVWVSFEEAQKLLSYNDLKELFSKVLKDLKK